MPIKCALSAFAVMASVPLSMAAQSLPPVRPLGPTVHVSASSVGRVTAARQLRNGRVLLNDVLSRRLLLFDSTLASYSVVADSGRAAVPYGTQPGGLIGFRGDSSLFVDASSLAMLVIDPDGKVVRTTAVPRAQDAGWLVVVNTGLAGFDGQGRLLYRGPAARPLARAPGEKPKLGLFTLGDSAPILRLDLATRKLDTVATIKIEGMSLIRSERPDGGTVVFPIENPMPLTDDWAVLPNGLLAVIRGRDYHVEWVGADGKSTTSPKLPFAWHRLDDSMKRAIVDSAKAAEIALERERRAAMSGSSSSGSPATRSGGLQSTGQIGDDSLLFVNPMDLPDYAPPFKAGTARADLAGNVWLRTSYAMGTMPVYDVINSAGVLVDRVMIPEGRVIAGFGDGVVYLGVRDGPGARLEVARIR